MSKEATTSDFTVQAESKDTDTFKSASFYVPATLRDLDYQAGLVLLLISICVFTFTHSSGDAFFGPFMVNYLIAIIYTTWLLITGKMRFFWKKQKKEFRAQRLLSWIIWLVSCFALNRAMPIFNTSTDWLSATIVSSGLICVLFPVATMLPLLLRKGFYFCFGVSTVLWVYYSLYLCWLYPISVPAILFFGLSIHSFIPLILLIAHFKIIKTKWNTFQAPIVYGIAAPIILFLGFYFQWSMVTYKIRNTTNEITTNNAADLPQWVILGQTLGNDWVTERLIKGNLVYQMPLSEISFLPESNNFRDQAQHDPFVLLASIFSPKTDLSEKERIKLLDVLFDARHDTQERLWSGKDLTTANLVTQAKIYPEYRMAYTEKTISIANHATSWATQQEALYTFYLPEGAVVSSLSLWMDGKEEKGYLTTRTKADSAYKTIVGVESRDPSVVHWQEGNTVKVKVFPCTPAENRRFKIGVTAPLKFEAGKLVYENIYFQGPTAAKASESIKLDFTQNASGVDVPFRAETSGKRIVSQRQYSPSWCVSFAAVPLATQAFTFQGKTFSVQPYQPATESFSAKNIYLDVNSAWTRGEFDKICSLLKNRNVYVYDDGFVRLTDANKETSFEKLQANRYTLFPVHKVRDPATSLLITKGTPTSLNLKDLSDSPFGDDLKYKLSHAPALRVFDFGNAPSPYIRTLKELRIVRCESMALNGMSKSIANHQFPVNPESGKPGSSTLRIGNAGLLISESEKPAASSAPDHLLRLFAYNHIMKQIGPQYLEQDYLKSSEMNAALIAEAEIANIVTPVSSLIVLETEADYKRFNIEKSRNSLDNATMKNSGAVPEPEEWLLIALFVVFVSYYTFRSYVL